MKFRNIRVLNIEGAMRYNDATTDSKYGLCSIDDIPQIIRERLGPTATQEDILADYQNVIQWNYGNGMVEYASLGLNDLEICDNSTGLFLSHIFVSFDEIDEFTGESATILRSYAELKGKYNIYPDEYKLFIAQLPYAKEWLTK